MTDAPDPRPVDVRVSDALQWIATNLEQAIADVAGERVAFALVVFTQPRTNYIANAPRELCVQEIKRLLDLWEHGMPDVPAHEVDEQDACACGNRACSDPWGPDCDLGKNEAHVAIAPEQRPVVDDAMIGRAYSAYINAKVADPTDTRARLGIALRAVMEVEVATKAVR